ncbi:MAG: hypothetical protein D3916_17535 [Candidatus Electrothrix sp. MAN1_4]|nr:hypothetical protein [Candidatus Electrothrix sp. MAN1_4]
MLMRRRPLFWQIFPVSLIIILCTVLAVSWFATTTFKKFYHDQLIVDIEAKALLLEQKIVELTMESQDVLQDFCRRAGRRAQTRITVVGPDGTILADSNEDPQHMEKHGRRPEITQAFSGQTGSSLRFSKTLQQDMFYVAIPLQLGPVDKRGALRLSVPATALDTLLQTIRNRIFLASLLTILGSTVFPSAGPAYQPPSGTNQARGRTTFFRRKDPTCYPA